MKRFLIILVAITMAITHVLPSFAAEQTTVIYLDNIKSTYDIGEELSFSIGVANPEGGFLKSAYCGFGYNQSTMELLSETDTEDHIWIKADAPQKRLISKEIRFRVKASGKIYFIAGAYSGPGQITGYNENGRKILCPRASVVYKAGTGIYTPTSDCDAKSISIYDKDTGAQIEFNRSFDKYSTEYTANVDPNVTEIRVEAEAAQADDKVIYPEETKLHAGINNIKVGIMAIDGNAKYYTFTILKPEREANVSDIQMTDNSGEFVKYAFDPDIFEYDLTVGQEVQNLYLGVVPDGDTEVEYPTPVELHAGYNTFNVTATLDSSKKVYEYYVYKEFSALTLSSLIVETPDGISHPFDKDFTPEQYEYAMQLTSDIDNITIIATPAVEGDYIKEDYGYPVVINYGENILPITVTDGDNEAVYTLVVTRDFAPVAYAEKPDRTPPKNTKEWTQFSYKDLSIFAKIGIPVLIVILIIAIIIAMTLSNRYKKSDEGRSQKAEKERKKRLKKANKDFYEQKNKREK